MEKGLTTILSKQVMKLDKNNPTMTSPLIDMPALTAEFVVRIKRPTKLETVNWDENSTVQVTLVYVVDGVEHKCTGRSTGGIRKDASGEDMPEYVLTYHPTTRKEGENYKRAGEDASIRKGYVMFEALKGTIQTEFMVEALDFPFKI